MVTELLFFNKWSTVDDLTIKCSSVVQQSPCFQKSFRNMKPSARDALIERGGDVAVKDVNVEEKRPFHPVAWQLLMLTGYSLFISSLHNRKFVATHWELQDWVLIFDDFSFHSELRFTVPTRFWCIWHRTKMADYRSALSH